MPSDGELAWRTCRVCGGAVPGDDDHCPTCGKTGSVPTDGIAHLPNTPRRRIRLAQFLRSAIVIGVAVALAWTLLSAVITGPPTIPDPLTTQGTYVVGPGNYTLLSGWITGEDYVDGNYTILSPVGTSVDLLIYNSSGYSAFLHGRPATPQWNQSGTSSSGIVFAAPYTDTFFLLFVNPYHTSSGIVETIYIATNYQTNVVIG